MQLTISQLATLQKIEEKKQQERIENIRVLLAEGFELNSLSKRGYTLKELDFVNKNYYKNSLEIRSNDNMENKIITNSEVPTKGKTYSKQLVLDRINNLDLISKFLHIVCENNTMTAVFPIIGNNTIESKEIAGKIIEKEIISTQALKNDLYNYDELILYQLNAQVEEEVELELVKIFNVLETKQSTSSETLKDILSSYPSKYINDLCLFVNELTLQKIIKFKNSNGDNTSIKYIKDKNGKIQIKADDIDIFINNNIDNNKIVMFNPLLIGLVSSNVTNFEPDIVTTNLKRTGRVMSRLTVAHGIGILKDDSVLVVNLV